MRRFLYWWRFYSFGREQYQECINNAFINNLASIRQGNTLVAIFAVVCSAVPLVAEDFNFVKAGICLGIGVVAILISAYANYVMQQINVSNRVIYFLITLFYANLMLFSTYFSTFGHPDKPASLVFCFFICALLLFINPPQFNLVLTLGAMAVLITCSVIVKDYSIWIYDVVYTVVAGAIGLFFSWHIAKLRLGLELSANQLEDERNKYVDQSITDELTQLRNRRDFMNTFQRYLSNYRSSDDWLCIAIADIDFFKFYNDHYGHPKGDECLRSIGAVLNNLKEELGVYTARVGGEEFAALWFEKDAAHVDNVITHWADAVKNLAIAHEKSKVNEYVTMSIGVYVSKCGVYQDTKSLYDMADKALYTAKGSGRNCAVVCGDEIKEYKITPDSCLLIKHQS